VGSVPKAVVASVVLWEEGVGGAISEVSDEILNHYRLLF